MPEGVKESPTKRNVWPSSRCVGVWLAPLAAPWLWAAVVGLGQGASFSLGLVLLVRYASTPGASGRLTGMAFFASYGIASVGPVAMGLVRDVTGSASDLVYEQLPIGDPVQRQPDITRARALLGWEPTVKLREGLMLMRDWYLEENARGRA